jgi:hypothetical protein
MMRLILPPLKWNKTTDGFDVDAARRCAGRWSDELSLAAARTVFPRPGQVWEMVRDCEVGFEACITYSGPKLTTVRPAGGVPVKIFAVGTRDVVLSVWRRAAHPRRTICAFLKSSNPLTSSLCGRAFGRCATTSCHHAIVPAELRACDGYNTATACVCGRPGRSAGSMRRGPP